MGCRIIGDKYWISPMLSRKHLLNVIILGAPLLVEMVSEFFMYAADSFQRNGLRSA
jgi:hypothetical protein